MLVLVMFAARVGPQRIIHGPLIDPKFAAGRASPTGPRPAPRSAIRRPGIVHSTASCSAIGLGDPVLLGCACLWLRLPRLFAPARGLGLRGAARPRARRDVAFDVLDDPDELAEEIRDDSDAQLALLLDGHARNAIVACWDRFEEQAERAGLARHAVGDLLGVHDPAARPGGRRRAARWRGWSGSTTRRGSPSTRSTRTDRGAAVEALEAIHLSLGARKVPGEPRAGGTAG